MIFQKNKTDFCHPISFVVLLSSWREKNSLEEGYKNILRHQRDVQMSNKHRHRHTAMKTTIFWYFNVNSSSSSHSNPFFSTILIAHFSICWCVRNIAVVVNIFTVNKINLRLPEKNFQDNEDLLAISDFQAATMNENCEFSSTHNFSDFSNHWNIFQHEMKYDFPTSNDKIHRVPHFIITKVSVFREISLNSYVLNFTHRPKENC